MLSSAKKLYFSTFLGHNRSGSPKSAIKLSICLTPFRIWLYWGLSSYEQLNEISAIKRIHAAVWLVSAEADFCLGRNTVERKLL